MARGQVAKRGPKPSPKRIAETQLLKALDEVAYEKTGDPKAKRGDGALHLLKHFVTRAYTSDMVLATLMKKLLPDKIKGEQYSENNITWNVKIETASGVYGEERKILPSSLPAGSVDGFIEVPSPGSGQEVREDDTGGD